METKNIKKNIRPADPFEENSLLIKFVCYGFSKEISYITYQVVTIMFFMFINCLTVYTLYVVSSDNILTAVVLHNVADTVWVLWTIASRCATERALMEMRKMINSGIFVYELEDLEEQQYTVLKGIAKEVRSKSNRYLIICFIGTFFGMFVFPLVDYLTTTDGDQEEYPLNPYLPHPCYYPFSTDTILGFTSAYIMDVLYWTYAYAMAYTSNGLLISSTVHLRAHLYVLNYSIMNIHKRAYKMFIKRNHEQIRESSMDELMQKEEFRRCLRSCLKANIEHHHAILRFKHVCQPYNGLSLLNMITVIVALYAPLLYLLLQDLPMFAKIKCAGTFIVEQNYSFLICNFGQDVLTESSALFGALYSTPWVNYDKDFKKTLHIVMSNSIEPMEIKAYLLDFSATLESFSRLQSAVYRVMSLWRQSDKIK